MNRVLIKVNQVIVCVNFYKTQNLKENEDIFIQIGIRVKHKINYLTKKIHLLGKSNSILQVTD